MILSLRSKILLPAYKCINIIAPVKKCQVLNRFFYTSVPQNCKPEKLILDVNQAKDQLLFVVNHDKFIRLMNIFGISQCIFWVSIGFTAKAMKTVPVVEPTAELPWWRTYDFSKYKYHISISAFCIGYVVLGGCWLYALRTIHHIVLRKGGKTVTISTYTPFFKKRFITVPLEEVSAKTSRIGGSYMSLKLQGRPFHYLVDGRGNFVRPELFDRTVGVRRDFKASR